jgi:hypothetical protein
LINPVIIGENESGKDNWYWYPPYGNYASSGMPDFDQCQDNWKNPSNGYWSFCGPTSLSNVL